MYESVIFDLEAPNIDGAVEIESGIRPCVDRTSSGHVFSCLHEALSRFKEGCSPTAGPKTTYFGAWLTSTQSASAGRATPDFLLSHDSLVIRGPRSPTLAYFPLPRLVVFLYKTRSLLFYIEGYSEAHLVHLKLSTAHHHIYDTTATISNHASQERYVTLHQQHAREKLSHSTSAHLHQSNRTPRQDIALINLLPDAFPASVAFDLINDSLNADEAERKDAIKKGKGIYAFTLKNKAGDTQSWFIDLKEKGAVGAGPAPEGGKADGEWLAPTDRQRCTGYADIMCGSDVVALR